jgi:FAD/FMN-containing dehydrogenase
MDRRDFLRAAAATIALGGCGRGDAGPTVEDVSRLEAYRVGDIVRPEDTAAVARAIVDGSGAVAIGGTRFSMGGQIAAPGARHLDMRALRGIVRLDPAAGIARVRAGTTWRDLQDHLDPQDLSVAIMQSYANFSVGGSVSVNCHGRYVGRGPVVNSVRALQLVLGDGRVVECSRTLEPELFAAAVGGYGGIGVITEVELDLARNERLRRHVEAVPLADYPAWFREHVLRDPDARLHNADLTPARFDEPIAVTWRRTDDAVTVPHRLVPRGLDYSREQNMIWAVSELPGGASLRRKLQASGESRDVVVWRNHEASLDAASLEPRTRAMSTYLLQEYFVPVEAFTTFARKMAAILVSRDVNALNVSIRHSPADPVSLLRWAPVETFCFVLYHKQRSFDRADASSRRWTRELIDAALDVGGRYYLPYRRHATRSQFERAYPQAARFAALREKCGATRFTNLLWDTYLA